MTGAERIASERQRQIEAEGWTAEHDATHDTGALTNAAISYSKAAEAARQGWPMKPWPDQIPPEWPWSEDWWKPSSDPIRNLEKAGALIAAEIDRLLSQPEETL